MRISKTQLWVAWARALVDLSVGKKKVRKAKGRLQRRSGNYCCLGVGLLVAEHLGIEVPNSYWREINNWSERERELFGLCPKEHDALIERNDLCSGWGRVLEHMQECAPTVRARSQIKKIVAGAQ